MAAQSETDWVITHVNVGTIDFGKDPNLVLTDENPLDDLSTLGAPHGVMVLGRRHEGDGRKERNERQRDRIVRCDTEE